jgi:preprotein translocase subunit SecF
MRLFENTNYDFIKWRWHALVGSALVILAGLGMIAARGGMPRGIDFTGGTIVVAKFEAAVADDAVRKALDAVPGEKVIQSYGDAADHAVLIRLPELAQEQGTSLEQGAKAVVQALTAAGLPKFEILQQEIVGPIIGRELQLKGFYATIASIVGITIYIALRFRPAFAVGAIAATLHDVLVTLAFLVFFGYDLSLNIVAALLTITGYSVNDTIVIFDRVRENMRSSRRDSLDKVVNTAVNQTLGRTIITAGTTFLSVLALFLFGGEVLHGFAFTMLVGIISGTYSTVFIAAAIAIILGNKQGAGAAAAVGTGAPAKVKAATARRS